MKQITKTVALSTVMALSGCYGDSLCDSYDTLPALDRNADGITDYRFQFIGDSILGYHEITCKSVSHYLAFELNEQIETHAWTGAVLSEIAEQYVAPVDEQADYEYVILNGGLNDLLANVNLTDRELTPCDCNGEVNHDACMDEVDQITARMTSLINNIQDTSSAQVGLVMYYPADSSDTFIGSCTPYVEALNNNYRSLANVDPTLQVIETYGAGQQVIPKLNVLGNDKYHPSPEGSQQMAYQVKEQLGLLELNQ